MTTFREDPAELDGVDVDVFAAGSSSERSSGRAAEREGEGLAVRAGPLGDDVGDDAAVVIGVDVECLGRRPGQIDAVHPDVAGEADVEEVADRLPSYGCGEVEQRGAGRWAAAGGRVPAALGSTSLSHSAMSSIGAEAGPLTHLELVHAVPPELGRRSRRRSGVPSVPVGRTRGARPGRRPTPPRGRQAPARPRARSRWARSSRRARSCGAELRTCAFSTRRDLHRLVVADPRDRGHVVGGCLVHCFPPFVWYGSLSCGSAGVARRRPGTCPLPARPRRTQRSPPGSFATC